jgi:hypothetical protein
MQADTAGVTPWPPLRIMIAGAPAAGKGTQCAKIVDKASFFLSVSSVPQDPGVNSLPSNVFVLSMVLCTFLWATCYGQRWHQGHQQG